eukprot:365231-Chlamydomonas_euryale.AAC.9
MHTHAKGIGEVHALQLKRGASPRLLTAAAHPDLSWAGNFLLGSLLQPYLGCPHNHISTWHQGHTTHLLSCSFVYLHRWAHGTCAMSMEI